MSTDNRALTGRALVKNFGNVHALAGVDIDIPSGQALAIMGPSGSGKSTLLHCLSGILTPTSGEICLGGKNVSGLPDKSRSRLRLKHFGFVFQDGQLVPELPANENVALPLMLSDASRRTAISAADDWLRRLGLEDEANRRPGEMSGGQAQRVAIARALAASPAVVFADEPTGALDQATGHEVMQLLTTTCRMSGATLVVVTHDPQVAAWCERLVEIRDGRIHADSKTGGAR
ncbi:MULTISPECIES: ABC transporter ATP-binding protein [Actinomycetaceae]|jgi:lipoprotein releasing system, ATP-binding protein lolD|uniref:ABC transporter ATP-binding protein n=1 Tax=Actinomycetaceae TaxID=2049 RepID=UPI0003966952|nr:ABC transporter ATP-binding protein [Actinobaculum sp. oral taxon 183]ERH19344.1 ABC transporter, ATP-binding protein [Actinobaculum sp. oral taxon 183 str. F0552]